MCGFESLLKLYSRWGSVSLGPVKWTLPLIPLTWSHLQVLTGQKQTCLTDVQGLIVQRDSLTVSITYTCHIWWWKAAKCLIWEAVIRSFSALKMIIKIVIDFMDVNFNNQWFEIQIFPHSFIIYFVFFVFFRTEFNQYTFYRVD